MERSSSAGKRSIKVYWWAKGVGEMGGYCCFAKVYSCFRGRAALTKVYLFFNINRVKRVNIVNHRGYLTHMTIYFEHL
jgi:hypothetical protein